MYNVYNCHKNSSCHTPTVVLPQEKTLDSVRLIAEAAAARGVDAFYRVFRVTSDSVSGERFATAFSVLKGVVREHTDVTIPEEHW